jgi:hypothetical protein
MLVDTANPPEDPQDLQDPKDPKDSQVPDDPDDPQEISEHDGSQWVHDITYAVWMGAMNYYPLFTEEEIQTYNESISRLGNILGFTAEELERRIKESPNIVSPPISRN